MPITVLLVDWPSPEVPRTLLAAGFAVLAANLQRGTASRWSLDERGQAAHHPLAEMPGRVDVVGVFRPAEEQPEIVRRAAAMGARLLWMQPGAAMGEQARRLALEAGMSVVEDLGLADAVRTLGECAPRGSAE